MKITYLRLKNYIGIFSGLGREEVEIDFSKNKSKFVLLKGSNGSGKTTILSALNPFASSNDNRNDIILEGKKGEKEIHYTMNNDTYIIVHYMDKTTKSYIKKNGVELNSSGSVKMFNEIIYTTFGIDKNHFKVARLGSNMTNFIDMPTAERKKYISNFISEVDYYLGLHKKANENLKDITSNNKYLENELSKLGDNASCIMALQVASTTLESLKKQDESLTKEINVLDYSIFEQDDIGLTNKYEREFNEVSNTYIKNKANMDNNVKTKPAAYNMTIELLNERIKENTLNKTLKEKELASINDRILVVNSDIDSVSKELSSINIAKIDGNVNEIEENIKKYQDMIELIKELKEPQIAKSFNNASASYIDLVITQYKKILLSKNDMLSGIDKEVYQNTEGLLASIDKLNEEKEEIDTKLAHVEAQRTTSLNEIKNEELIEKRPEGCVINSCPFISHLLKSKGASSRVEQYTKEIAELTEQLNKIYAKLKDLHDILARINSFNKSFDIEMFKLVNGHEDIYNATENMNELENYKEYLLEQENLVILSNKVNDLNNSLVSYYKLKEANKLVEDKYNSLSSKLEELKAEKAEIEPLTILINSDIALLSKKITNALNIIKEKEELANLEVRYNELKCLYDEYATKIDNKRKMQEKVTILKSELSTTHNSIKAQEDLILNLNVQKKEREKFETLLEENLKKFNPMKVLTEALSQTKGIPLFFISKFFDNVTSNTNELLNMAFKGKFQVSLDINESDFLIPIFKEDGTILRDIKDASQGEISLTTVSLSLSIINNISSKYNIIYLDEIDGPLDVDNRRTFLDMLSIQMERLSCEQIFIISHNDVFDSSDAGTILLRNNGNLSLNDNIIFDYRNN